ncbi:hypothetical protein JIX56_42240 [Streptomyces sp. CA-210063]|uniref:hypothetical protein n=1 Tax=Streptomyces sp. CA-210063 TaxID=2801029 RepID=UPI00214B5810|nr:hypothetical protein [Streptomyces sp. CA-210063]UUU35926.1 hypothetical protein JIX56_42240 [Streptomyces sp. CA-210063]
MSTGRGRFGIAVASALTVVLTGCGGGGGQDDGSGEGTEPSSTTRTPSAAGTSDEAGTPPPRAERPASPTTSATDDGDSGGSEGDRAGESGAADGTDVDACFDGRCEIAVSKPLSIKVDSRFGVSDLRVTKVTADTVVLQSSGAGTFLSSSIGEGGTGGLNGLGFRVTSLEGGTAVLEFFPRA